jgi:cytochrome c oxidase cbb3-type subunit I
MSKAQSSSKRFAEAASEVDASCRGPLLLMLACSAFWLAIASGFTFIASLKFHSPNLLADTAWLTYGRVRPAASTAILYGFCLQAGLAIALWLLARLGRTPLAHPWLVVIGTLAWNGGVKLGLWGVLSGDGAGFEYLDLPVYSASTLFLGYLLIGLAGILTFHQRRERTLFVSQWFVLAALFWFPWSFSNAVLLLLISPVRGAAQIAIWSHYVANLQVVWLALVGLGIIFYFVPKLTGRDLSSRYSALLVFWWILLFGGWGNVPAGAPLPAWLPALSALASMLWIVPVVVVAMLIHQTLGGQWARLWTNPPSRFIFLGTLAFLVAGLMKVGVSAVDDHHALGLTWFAPAQAQLSTFGFFGLVLFGAAYWIVPQLTGLQFPAPKLLRAHLWLALLGLLLAVVPLAIGGVLEMLRLEDAANPFMQVVKTTLPFLRVSTMGDLLLALGNLFFLVNLVWLALRFYQPRLSSAYARVTVDLPAVEAKP